MKNCKPYTHIGVYGVCISDGHILLVQKARGPHRGKWDLPGGKIEFGESPKEALRREFEEETGLTKIDGSLNEVLSYTIVYPFNDEEWEELHHIGIIYRVHPKERDAPVRAEADGEDSLGARWMPLQSWRTLEVTPFVEQSLTMMKQGERVQ